MERHHPYCATCRASLCAPCALSAAHRDHYLLSRAAPLPCASCADGASAQALQAAGLPETFSTAVTEALFQLQLLLLDCTRGGSRVSRHCDVMGALPLDLALGLLPQPQGAEPALPAVLRAVQRCPMLTCTRVSGANALVGLHHPRAHELLALAAPHAARLPQPLPGRAARALAERGLLPRTLAALADSSRAPLWSPQACSPTPAAAAAASPLALLPPPRLACHPAPGQSGPPPALQYLSAAAAAAATASTPTAAAAPTPLALRTPLEFRAWVRRIMEALAGSAPAEPGEVKGVCVLHATQRVGAGLVAGVGARAARLARLDLACSLPGIGSASLDMEAMSAACVSERVGEETAGGGAAGRAGSAEASEPPLPSALTLLHPLLPLLLHPALLKAVRSADTLAVLAAEAGLHAVNTLCLDIAAEEMQACALGVGLEEWQALRCNAQAACSAAAEAGSSSSSSSSSEAAQQALQLTLHWLRLTALLPSQSAAQSSTAAPASAPASASAPPPPCALLAAIHCAWLCSQLSGLSPPIPASAGPALALPRKRTLETALASQHNAYLLTMPPWYLECMGCRAECAGHFIVDCPAWLLNA